MTAPIKWGSYGKYSGPFITGTRNTPTVSPPDVGAPFMTAAFWITIMAECLARFGVVNMRDGTGVTAGLHQAVACYPRQLSAQGPLFKLLWRVNQVIDIGDTRLGSLLAGQEWTLAADGTLIEASGRPVKGSKFRATVTPPEGCVVKGGAEWRTSRLWARAFHELFVDERTHRVQIMAGIEALQKKICRFRAKKYLNGATIEEVAFAGHGRNPYPFMTVEAELAHAVLLSFAINAPTWAFQVYNAEIKKACRRCKMTIEEAIRVGDDRYVPVRKELLEEIDTARFGRGLIRALANKSRKWDDDVRGSRYQRTRQAAMQVWMNDWAEDVEINLFGPGGVMAEDLPG